MRSEFARLQMLNLAPHQSELGIVVIELPLVLRLDAFEKSLALRFLPLQALLELRFQSLNLLVGLVRPHDGDQCKHARHDSGPDRHS
jgi:hypothetical protein